MPQGEFNNKRTSNMTVEELTSLCASGKLDDFIDQLCSEAGIPSPSEEVEAKATPMPAPKIEELAEERVELDSKPLDSKPMTTPRIQDSEKKDKPKEKETPKPQKQDSEKKAIEKKPKPPKAKKQDSEKSKGEKKPLIRMKDRPKEEADQIRKDARVYRWIRAANLDYPPSKIPKDAERNATYARKKLDELKINWKGVLKKKTA